MHVILGAGGPVSNALTHKLLQAQQTVKLISRRPVNIGQATWAKADLLSYQELSQAVKGASVIYLCAGLKYDAKVWALQWPLIMRNVIDLAKANSARLIFFDNVYMYGLVEGKMTEDTPYHPISKKGEVRAKVAEQLMEEAKAGNIQASIGRAADFYGAQSLNSFYDGMVLAKYAQGGRAMWLGDAATKHSFTYIPDAAEGMFLLGQHPETDNQIWHLPTAPALSGHDFLELAARAYAVKTSYIGINKFLLQLAGVFDPLIRGTVEMYYQYQHDYIFDSSRFERHFGIAPTSYAEGIKEFSALLQQLVKP